MSLFIGGQEICYEWIWPRKLGMLTEGARIWLVVSWTSSWRKELWSRGDFPQIKLPRLWPPQAKKKFWCKSPVIKMHDYYQVNQSLLAVLPGSCSLQQLVATTFNNVWAHRNFVCVWNAGWLHTRVSYKVGIPRRLRRTSKRYYEGGICKGWSFKASNNYTCKSHASG